MPVIDVSRAEVVVAGETMAAGLVEGMVKYTLGLGVDERDLFGGTGLSPAELSPPEKAVPLGKVAKLWANATVLSGDPAFSLHLGESSYCADMSIVGMLGESGGSFGDALEQVRRFSKLAIGGPPGRPVGPDLSVEGGLASISVRGGCDGLRKSLSENHLSRMVGGMRRAVARDLKLVSVSFQHPEPDYAQEYDRIFGAPVLFNQATSCITFACDFLDAPMRRPNPHLNRILSERAQDMLEDLPSEQTFTASVEAYVRRHLHEGALSVCGCASALGVSKQTLQRRLRCEDVCFKEVVESVRQELADSYLAQGELNMSEVAFLLGYSEPSSFTRAFKRWKGVAPSVQRDG